MKQILIIDFGSQYTQLIARRVREQNVFCSIQPFHNFSLKNNEFAGVILSGGPASVNSPGSPDIDLDDILGKIPLLGVCYGAQLLAKKGGGTIENCPEREYGLSILKPSKNSELLAGLGEQSKVWMSHGDTILDIPVDFELTGSSDNIRVAAFENKKKKAYAIQFHPEVTHSEEGAVIIKNFLINICKCQPDWTSAHFSKHAQEKLKATIGSQNVICGLSGGVDSTVAAVLLQKAIGKQLTCIFVDNGLLRKDEFTQVMEDYKLLKLKVIGIDARKRFLDELSGITDPEQKRKTIGRVFVEVFEEEAKKIDGVTFLAQGTIYPDVIESVSVNGPSATIKSHHNVGGLPEKLNLKIVEPLRELFKDEVRRVGLELGIAPDFIHRHPFPGPGLAIRLLGEVNEERLKLLREADHIFIEGLKSHDLYNEVWQAFVVLLPVSSVGVMGDERTYENVVALRTVTSIDGMTADWGRLPFEFLAKMSRDIINKVKGINRVVYDISSKPPATIEWE